MTIIDTLLENEGVQNYMKRNASILEDAENKVDAFKDYLKDFIKENPDEFICDDISETYKNIRVFTEVACSQFMTEISAISAKQASPMHTVSEGGLGDYI